MNRKTGLWVSLVSLFMSVGIILSACANCTTVAAAEENENGARFTIESETTDGLGTYACVITDTETGVQYLFVRNNISDSGGLVVMPEPPKGD